MTHDEVLTPNSIQSSTPTNYEDEKLPGRILEWTSPTGRCAKNCGMLARPCKIGVPASAFADVVNPILRLLHAWEREEGIWREVAWDDGGHYVTLRTQAILYLHPRLPAQSVIL